MSVCTIRSRVQQSGMSARHPLLRLPLTENHRRLRRKRCNERRAWTMKKNDIVFTNESHFTSATSLRYWSPWSSHAFSACHQPYSNRLMRDRT
ncbi:hypothetical protein TNCV_1891531 [Trichonephila clavipes]|nr:hypothetical protein TNCV_1891531 [Trichonephila clavipes]